MPGRARATLKQGIAREHCGSPEMLGSVAARAVSTCCKADYGPTATKGTNMNRRSATHYTFLDIHLFGGRRYAQAQSTGPLRDRYPEHVPGGLKPQVPLVFGLDERIAEQAFPNGRSVTESARKAVTRVRIPSLALV
jgi:hypothetical protein